MKKIWQQKRWLRILTTIVSVFFVLILIFRNQIFRFTLNKAIAKAEARYPVKITYSDAAFEGLSGLYLNELLIQAHQNDTLLTLNSLKLNMRLLPLLTGKIRFSSVYIDSTELQIIQKKGADNFSFLLKKSNQKTKKQNESSENGRDYAEIVRNLLHTIFDAIPPEVRITHTGVLHETDSLKINLNIPSLSLVHNDFNTSFLVQEKQDSTNWEINGIINRSDETARVRMYNSGKKSSGLPWLKSFYNLTVGFDTIYASLEPARNDGDELILDGKLSARNLLINHWRISPKPVKMVYAGLNYHLHIGPDYAELDSTSTAQANELRASLFLNYSKQKSTKLGLIFNVAPVASQQFFNAFPEGLFQSLEGMKVSGELGYRLQFFIDTQKPDSLIFSSGFKRKKFRIEKYGNVNLSKINDEFLHTVYEKGIAVKTFTVGPSNPNFVPLHLISPYLQYAVMTSEDGTFMYHNGFNEEAFKKSIAENYKKGKFARGGSTISMQLVKNVFLTRHKTIARKMEEALIVWLIESNRLASKERMLEVYLNIIEWGPGIYGITEASDFYFKKRPAELSLAESIYLAMIIPRPKWFKYNFENDGKLKAHTESYFRLIAGHLLRKEIISEEEKNALVPSVELTGVARNIVFKTDTIKTDTIAQPTDELFSDDN